MKRTISDVNPALQSFEASCFDGIYVTGDITQAYLDRLEFARHNPKSAPIEDAVATHLHLASSTTE